MKHLYTIRFCYLLIFSFELVTNLYCQQQKVQVIYEMRGTTKNSLKDFFKNHTEDLDNAVLSCISHVKNISTAEIKLMHSFTTAVPKVSQLNEFYIWLAFEEFPDYKNDILFHISFYDKNKSEWVQTNSFYLKWASERQDIFFKSTKELIENQFLSDLQYFVNFHQNKPKKTLTIAPIINSDLCKDAIAHPMYSKLLFKCPQDITENIKQLGKTNYLFKIVRTNCFEILFRIEKNSVDSSKVKFDMSQVKDGPINDVNIEDFYEMWRNRDDKRFDDLCNKIFKKLKYQECQ